ncbi:hypothetical protein [Paenibacillus paridis]|uniref:hypothetical protein n=1 Tax=Paenibacillus paridis TaxID=2583376 RepID=UPI00111E9DA5|nr:hypothetical protein [Paenibacillus paridis]
MNDNIQILYLKHFFATYAKQVTLYEIYDHMSYQDKTKLKIEIQSVINKLDNNHWEVSHGLKYIHNYFGKKEANKLIEQIFVRLTGVGI